MKQRKEIKLFERGSSRPAIPVPDRFRGALLGLAAGDAVGTTLEFKSPGSFKPINDMVGGGPFDLAPGEWTDDTSMALCLAASLVEKRGFYPRDQMERYVRWWKEGYMAANGRCFDIGNTVRSALVRFLSTGDPNAGSTDPNTAGNGSIMRLAPVPLFYAADPRLAIEQAANSSRTTQRAIQSRRDSRKADGDLQNWEVPEPAIIATAQRLMRSDLSQPQ
jgi:ADP-ribosyl-[dinitrogen reductase] hydrolase